MATITVKRGDCIASIAATEGFLTETIWEYAGNKTLKELRKDPMVLYKEDKVLLPERKEKCLDGVTDQAHKFV